MKFGLSYAFAAILAVGCCHALAIDWDLLSAPHVAKHPEPLTFGIAYNRPAPPTRPKETIVIVEVDHKKETRPQPLPAVNTVPFAGEQFGIFPQQPAPAPAPQPPKPEALPFIVGGPYHVNQKPKEELQEPATLPFFVGGPYHVNQKPKEELQEPEALPFIVGGPFHVNQKPKEPQPPQPPLIEIVHHPKPQPKPIEVIDLEFSVKPAKPVDMVDGVVVPSPKYPDRSHREIDVAIHKRE